MITYLKPFILESVNFSKEIKLRERGKKKVILCGLVTDRGLNSLIYRSLQYTVMTKNKFPSVK